MEIAKITYVCKSCGGIFLYEKQCHNRLEAEMFEQKAARRKRVCPACYRKSQTEAFDMLITELNLPPITGVSEKQIAYAASLRERFVLKNQDMLRYAKAQLDRIVPGNVPDVAKKWGIPVQQCVQEAFRGCELEKAYVCLAESSAKKIIDQLR